MRANPTRAHEQLDFGAGRKGDGQRHVSREGREAVFTLTCLQSKVAMFVALLGTFA